MQIRFRDFSTADWIPAYVVADDEKSVSYIEPACFSWVQFLKRERDVSGIRPFKIMMNLEDLIYERNLNTPYIPSFLFEFPIDDARFVELNTLTIFFQKISLRKNETLSFEHLERAIERTYFFFQNEQVLTDAVDYLLLRYNAHKDRLRLLQYPMIMKYIKKNVKSE